MTLRGSREGFDDEFSFNSSEQASDDDADDTEAADGFNGFLSYLNGKGNKEESAVGDV